MPVLSVTAPEPTPQATNHSKGQTHGSKAGTLLVTCHGLLILSKGGACVCWGGGAGLHFVSGVPHRGAQGPATAAEAAAL